MELTGVMADYADLVRTYSERLDLVSPGDLDRFEERHVEDSLRALPYVREAPPGPAVDVGSGAGLPGIPLAISDPDREWRLLEPRKRRAAFLEAVVRDLNLDNVEVVTATAQMHAVDVGAVHVIATARALAPPVEAVELLRPLVAPGGSVLLFVGKSEPAMKDAEHLPGLVRVVV